MNTHRKNATTLRNVVKELGRDPQVKHVIAKGWRQSRGKGTSAIESLVETYLLLLAISARFSGKKKARALEKHMDLVHLLTQASLLLKQNIFDRPEVRRFFRQSGKRVSASLETLQRATPASSRKRS